MEQPPGPFGPGQGRQENRYQGRPDGPGRTFDHVRRGPLVIRPRRHHSRCPWGLVETEQVGAEEVEHSILYGKGTV